MSPGVWISPGPNGTGTLRGINTDAAFRAFVPNTCFNLQPGTCSIGDLENPCLGLPGFRELNEEGGFIPAPADCDQMQQHALNSMMPSIRRELSALNSLYELKDLPSIAETVKEIVKARRALSELASIVMPAQGIRKYLKNGEWWAQLKNRFRSHGSSTKSLGQIVRGLASSHLQASFNILPMMADIDGVCRAVTSFETRMRRIVARSLRKQYKHFTVVFDESPSVEETVRVYNQINSLVDPPDMGDYYVNRFVRSCPSVFHVEMQYNFHFTALQASHARLLTLLDALGVKLDFSIIWNALPWSFVVDWFADLSQFFSQFSIDNMKPTLNVCKYCWSVKRKREIHFRIESGLRRLGYLGTAANGPSFFESAYRRSTVWTDVFGLVVRGVTTNKVTLGASLVLTRHKKRSRL